MCPMAMQVQINVNCIEYDYNSRLQVHLFKDKSLYVQN